MSNRHIKDRFGERVVWLNKKGEKHRLNGPAVEWISGSEEW